jgi:hypothetical protein
MNVLFGDGHVEFILPAQVEGVLQRLPTTRSLQPTTRGGV